MQRLEITAEPGKPTFTFRRTFAYPRELVWEAMTKPEHVLKWYGPRSVEAVRCEMDFRVGGAWRTVLRAPDGREAVFSGEYKEIVPLAKITQTWRFEGIPGAESLETITLESQRGRTVVHGLVVHGSPEARDGHLKAMEPGASETYQRLEELLATLS